MAKKSERPTSAGEKKNKKKMKSQPSAVAMKMKTKALNPFESIWSRRKFDILGKKRKGEERRIGLARSAAIDKVFLVYLFQFVGLAVGFFWLLGLFWLWQRKKTLLKEYERSGKASQFVDKRIGEDNEDMGEFQQAL